MRFLFFVLFLGMLQPAIATEAFNDQELEALKEIKAIAEGRLRYNQILLDILNEEGVDAATRVKNYSNETGLPAINYNNVDIEGLINCVTTDISRLTDTKRIVNTCISVKNDSTQTNLPEILAFLHMNISFTHMCYHDEYKKRDKRISCNNDFFEYSFYEEMLENAKLALRAPAFHEELIRQFSIEDDGFHIAFNNSAYESLKTKYDEISKKQQLVKKEPDLPINAWIAETLQLLTLYSNCQQRYRNLEFTEHFEKYETNQKVFGRYFWPAIEIRTHISQLEAKFNDLESALRKQLEEELLGDRTTEKPLSKTQLKKLNKQKAASSPEVPDAAVATASAEASVSVPSWKPVHLPPSDRALSSSSSSSSSPNSSSTLALTSAMPRLKISTSSSSSANAASSSPSAAGASAAGAASATTITDAQREGITRLKTLHILDFEEAITRFRSDFSATIEAGAKYRISLSGPTGRTYIYFDNPHAVQLKKSWPAWRIGMKKALEDVGY
ncbi:MAG: hypothetical protein WCJ92_06635 [Alphaproteobacteria bacterium]